jgi:hypothetical protein
MINSKKNTKKSTKKSSKKGSKKYWSHNVTKNSDAMTLEEGIFTKKSPEYIANSVYNSAKNSDRKKASTAYQSAISMINFYINRAGKKLNKNQKKILEKSKDYLKKFKIAY